MLINSAASSTLVNELLGNSSNSSLDINCKSTLSRLLISIISISVEVLAVLTLQSPLGVIELI